MILAIEPENPQELCGGPSFQVQFVSATYGSGHRKMVARHLLLPSLNNAAAEDAPKTNGNGDDAVHEQQSQEQQQQQEEEGAELISKNKEKRHHYKALTKVAATNEVLDPSLPRGFVARHHYTTAQVDILLSMKRGSSGISYEQAVGSCYGGELNTVEDIIPIQRGRDKHEVERYFITPSVPREVVAANVLQCLESKFCDGKTSTQEDEICREAVEITNSEEQKWKWRCLFAEREIAKLKEKQKEMEEMLLQLNNENKQLAEKNRTMSRLVEEYKERQHKEEVEAIKRRSKLRQQITQAEATSARKQQRQIEATKAFTPKQQENQGTSVGQSKPHIGKLNPPPSAMPCYPPTVGRYPMYPRYFPVVPPLLPGIPPPLQQQMYNNPYSLPNQSNNFFRSPPMSVPTAAAAQSPQPPPSSETASNVPSQSSTQQTDGRKEGKNVMNINNEKSPSKRLPPSSSQSTAVGEGNSAVETRNCPPPQKKSKGEKVVWV